MRYDSDHERGRRGGEGGEKQRDGKRVRERERAQFTILHLFFDMLHTKIHIHDLMNEYTFVNTRRIVSISREDLPELPGRRVIAQVRLELALGDEATATVIDRIEKLSVWERVGRGRERGREERERERRHTPSMISYLSRREGMYPLFIFFASSTVTHSQRREAENKCQTKPWTQMYL